jgi:hypothetical protein
VSPIKNIIVTCISLAFAAGVCAQDLTEWVKQTPIKPDASKLKVPEGYKASVFVEGLSTPSSATVDKDGNVWVAISGNLFGGPDAELMDPPHVKVFDKGGKLIKEIGKGTFKTVLNELSYCAENGKTYIPEYGERIWEIDGLNGELKVIIRDLQNGDHRNGGITCEQRGLRRSRQPRLDRHPERPVLAQASGRPRHDAA